MSILLITAGIAVGTPAVLLSLAYLAALSAYSRQALQDEEDARLWARAPVRPHPLPAAVVIRAAPRRRRLPPAACSVLPKAAANPRPRGQPKNRATR
jgi:hypothetical protein